MRNERRGEAGEVHPESDDYSRDVIKNEIKERKDETRLSFSVSEEDD